MSRHSSFHWDSFTTQNVFVLNVCHTTPHRSYWSLEVCCVRVSGTICLHRIWLVFGNRTYVYRNDFFYLDLLYLEKRYCLSFQCLESYDLFCFNSLSLFTIIWPGWRGFEKNTLVTCGTWNNSIELNTRTRPKNMPNQP